MLCARLQIYDRCRVRNLTPQQIINLTSFLSSPATAPQVAYPAAPPDFVHPKPSEPINSQAIQYDMSWRTDRLKKLRIEAELKREMRENIAHQRMIGSYVGRRHAMGLPVRGQNTQTNAQTAKKLNRVERYA